MNTLHLTTEQLQLVQQALDFYSRIGIGQFTEIKDHPTFHNHLYKVCAPKKVPEVGDRTPQGEILEIKDGKALIAGSVVDGRWNEKHEWKKLEDVELSTNYTKFHAIQKEADEILSNGRNTLTRDFSVGTNGSWGIFNESVDESCRMAFDIVQVIRHEFYKKRGENSHTVDSHIHFSSRKDGSSKLIKCELSEDN